MIEEFVREMSADERSALQGALRTLPAPTPRHLRQRLIEPAAVLALFVGLGVFMAIRMHPIAAAPASGFALVFLYRLVVAYRGYSRARTWHQGYGVRRQRELERALEDGRVTVKRVRAVAVVEIEPMEDEGAGYLFDLGDGRVLFLKIDLFPLDEETPWPNTEFEIVRRHADGAFMDLHGRGTALPPLRVIRSDEYDPEGMYEEREEVLEMSLDEAVRTVVRPA